MTPHQQFAESHKYTAIQYCFIPQPDGLISIFVSYGGARTYQKTVPPEEIVPFLTDSFTHRHTISIARKRHEELTRLAEPTPSLDLDLGIDLGI